MELLKISELKDKTVKVIDLLSEEDTLPTYVFSGDVNTELYDDITSNKNWMEIGQNYYDFMFCRNQVMQWTYVKTVVMGQPFSALTLEDQQYAAQVYAVGQTERESVYNQDELLGFWGDFIGKAKESRTKRWEAAKAKASFELSTADSIDLAKSTSISKALKASDPFAVPCITFSNITASSSVKFAVPFIYIPPSSGKNI